MKNKILLRIEKKNYKMKKKKKKMPLLHNCKKLVSFGIKIFYQGWGRWVG